MARGIRSGAQVLDGRPAGDGDRPIRVRIMTGSRLLRIRDRHLEAFLDAGPPDIGTVWELCMYFEFDRAKTVDGIAEWLGPPSGLRVLDCACGSGFPALGLIAKGYDVTCTDGSELMT